MSAAAVIRTLIDADGSPLSAHDVKAISEGYNVSRAAVDAYSQAYAAHLRARNDGARDVPLPDETGLREPATKPQTMPVDVAWEGPVRLSRAVRVY